MANSGHICFYNITQYLTNYEPFKRDLRHLAFQRGYRAVVVPKRTG